MMQFVIGIDEIIIVDLTWWADFELVQQYISQILQVFYTSCVCWFCILNLKLINYFA